MINIKDEILRSLKQEYQQKCEKHNQFIETSERIKQLELIPEVKEYIGLLDIMDNLSVDNLIDKDNELVSIFTKYARNEIHETNDIMIYLGTYTQDFKIDEECNSKEYTVARDNPEAEFSVYADLEKDIMYSFKVAIEERAEFEKNHHIIIPDTLRTEQYFYNLQRKFIKETVNSNQETAVVKVLKKAKIS